MSTVKYRWLQVLGLLLIAVMLMSALQPNVAAARSATTAPKFQSGKAQGPVSFAVSRELRSIPVKPSTGKTIDGLTPDAFGPYKELPHNLPIPARRSLNPNFVVPPGPHDIDPFVRNTDKRLPDDPMPGADIGLEGLNQGSNRTIMNFGVLPPDTIGSASRDFYIQTVNSTIGIWDLNQNSPLGTKGKLVYGPAMVNSLWTGAGGVCEEFNDGDPITIWDDTAQRFLVTQFALPNYPAGPFYECIAISKTANPMQGFYLYTYQTHPTKMDDYPKFGVWQDGYYMSVNQFEAGVWAGEGVAVFERDQMILGNPLARLIYVDTDEKCIGGLEPECVLGGMLPSDAEGALPAAGTPNYFMQFDDNAWGYSPDQLQVWQMTTDWTAGTATFAHVTDLPVAAFDSEVCTGYARNCIAQPGTIQGVDSISDRLMYRLQYRKFSDHASMVVNHTVQVDSAVPKGQAGIRWYELRDTGAGWSIYQQGTYAPDTDSRWMGSMAMDKDGNIALGFSRSNGTVTYPSIATAGRKAADPLGTLPQTEVVLFTGLGAQTSSAARWGDYSMMDVGPDGCSFWYTTEYLRGTTSAEWYTKIAKFHYATCDGSPETLITSAPTLPVHSPSATFSFSGTDDVSVASFECALDAGAFAACTSPKTYTNLLPGTHTFQVRAIDSIGQPDPTPASFTWNADYVISGFSSSSAEDGYLLESTATSGLGGWVNSTSTGLVVGDDNLNREFRTILSFDTASLPDNAVVFGVTLKLKKAYGIGTDPFSTHGLLRVDLRAPYFGAAPALAVDDFNAAASMTTVGVVGTVPVGGFYTSNFGAPSFVLVNRTGLTQLRLRFTMGDDGNSTSDYVTFYSGNYATLALQPAIQILYYVP
jgi:hypothetical protein